ncbi:MAG TPA: MarR family transcriptional regulator [Lichenihabitans sp.]|jgi:DNA-binding MarR family transcriptional regulator|nr:MarR family transcriptional regulator [Lichenihabitans sp.]
MDCTCSALRMAARRMTQAYDAALAPLGLNTPQFALLGALDRWKGAPPTVRQMAQQMALDRTTLAHNLRPLERDGLVEVVADPEDRRIRRIVLTEAGRARRAAAFPLWRAAQDRFDATFGDARSRDLMATLEDIARHLDLSVSAAAAGDHSHAG